MSDVRSVVGKYIDTWNEAEPRRRRLLIAQVFAEDAVYTDPLASVRGYDAIDQLIAGAQSQFGGLQFSLAGSVDAHHEQARFNWYLGLPGAEEPIAVGFDVVLMQDNRIQSVFGFLDKVPALT